MSQNQPVTEDIEGIQYTFYMLPPMTSHNLLMDVAKMIGPAVGPVLDSALKGESSEQGQSFLDKEVGPEFFTNAAGALFRELDKNILERVIKEFSQSSEADGAPLNKIFDAHFQGALDRMYKWLAFGMRVQWGKSLSALVSGIESRRSRRNATQESPSPNTSTG